MMDAIARRKAHWLFGVTLFAKAVRPRCASKEHY